MIPKTVGVPTQMVYCSGVSLIDFTVDAFDKLFDTTDVKGSREERKSTVNLADVKAPRRAPLSTSTAVIAGRHVLNQVFVSKEACLAELDTEEESLYVPLDKLLTDAGVKSLLKHPGATVLKAHFTTSLGEGGFPAGSMVRFEPTRIVAHGQGSTLAESRFDALASGVHYIYIMQSLAKHGSTYAEHFKLHA